jgi:hypothetical protein
MTTIDYAELHCLSNFTFLRGASHPEELVEQAAVLGNAALALTDCPIWTAPTPYPLPRGEGDLVRAFVAVWAHHPPR